MLRVVLEEHVPRSVLEDLVLLSVAYNQTQLFEWFDPYSFVVLPNTWLFHYPGLFEHDLLHVLLAFASY